MASYNKSGALIGNHVLTGVTAILPKSASTGSSKKSGGSSGGGGGGGGGSGEAAPAINYQAELQRLVTELYENTFVSDPITYNMVGEEELSRQVAAWLRPSYDQAIFERGERTKRYNAELDADAISRGMGASTFVTDVKSRNRRDEARDVALLESEYGATLAKNVSERIDAEKDRALSVDMFNKEQEQFEYELAYDAATVLLATMTGGKVGGGGRGGGSRKKGYRASAASTKVTTRANCEALLSVMSASERANLYTGSSADAAACRNEIIASVGLAGYYELQGQYGA